MVNAILRQLQTSCARDNENTSTRRCAEVRREHAEVSGSGRVLPLLVTSALLFPVHPLHNTPLVPQVTYLLLTRHRVVRDEYRVSISCVPICGRSGDTVTMVGCAHAGGQRSGCDRCGGAI
eukprot:7899295-Pyramimonas_sp.AAC.1